MSKPATQMGFHMGVGVASPHRVAGELEHPKHQERCAICPEPATGWSGVEDWQDADGAWIGWCGNDHRNRWLRGER